MARSDTGAAAKPDPLIGKRIGSYEVLARVARGGMGVVYRARHIYIDKVVALKVLDPALSARPELIERFRTEAQSLARVEHENVIKVIDILEDQGVHCIVMDFAEGENLRQQVKKHGPLPADELLSVARQSAEALFAAHREGILHRDIKPENLIMNARGRCKLADFGLAGDLRLISEGHEGPLNFGTPAYSSPEVLRRVTPDNRSDLFSYAATLYFLATGEPPFGQTGSQQILLKQKQGVQPLDQRRPDLPIKLTRLVTECLAWHPKDRPESFREVLDRLPRRAYPRPMGGATEPTGLATAETTTELSPQRSRWITLLAFGMAAVALAVVGVVWWLNRDGSDPDPVATANDSPHPPRQSRPPDSAPTKPDENPVNPTPRAEEEAFNSAELDSRTALSRADYKAAWDALSAFMRDYPESGLLERALRQRSSVLTRVRDLRDAEFRKAKEAAAQALKDKRTEEAMAALDRFPSELLVPLSDDDHVAVATQLDTQRRLVEAAEATDLAAVMKRADTLREDWGRARNHPAGVTEQTRLNVAGNLLLERDLLEEFLAGRLKSSRDKIEKRLASLRMLLESVHQDALEPANAWRQFQDQTLGEWALWMSGRLGDCTPLLRKRDFAGAVNVAQAVGKELTQRVGEFKPHDPGVAELARRSRILQDTLGRVVQDLRLPLEAEALCESELRSLAGTSVARDYHVHEQVEAGGERSARILRYSGRVLSAGNGEFRVETDSGRVTLRIDMLTVASFRKVLSGVLRPEDRAAVAAWCAFQGRAEDANTELETLLELAPADPEVTARARALCASTLPAPGVLRTLRYLAAKSGHISRDGFEAMPEAGLLAAQDGVNAGSMESARVYIGLVAQLVDPEMVHLATYERALELANAGENHLRNRTILEPLSADAWVAAAKALQDTDLPQARAYARKALLVDASSVEAWEILR